MAWWGGGGGTITTPNIKIKKINKRIKILGFYFTYGWRKRQEVNFDEILKSLSKTLRKWQYRNLKALANEDTCCGHIVADTNVSSFARARNICCGHKFCVRDTKNVSDFGQKHFVSATNASQFAQPKKHHGQQCVRNNVSSFTRALTLYGKIQIVKTFAIRKLLFRASLNPLTKKYN